MATKVSQRLKADEQASQVEVNHMDTDRLARINTVFKRIELVVLSVLEIFQNRG